MTVRFADLVFEPHAMIGQARVERAYVEFPNGWAVSILRGMAAINVHGCDYEVCPMREGHPSSPLKRYTPEEVQREIEAVAAL
jgi:hypothetical protein